MWLAILQLIYLLLPAGFANISASLSVKFFPHWNSPLDFHASFRGKRILGSHKTFRGLFFGIAGGIIGSAIQLMLLRYSIIQKITLISYSSHSFILIGFLLGTGAVFGDSAKSFFKRQLSIAPGKSFMPFDQIDWVLGSLLFILPFYQISLSNLLILCVSYFIIHIIVRWIGYLLNLAEEKL